MTTTKTITHQRYQDVQPYETKDCSTIRELMHPAVHGNHAQSLAEAIIPAGGRTLLHQHHRSEEIYYIIRGEGMMTLDSETFLVQAGDTVCIPAGTPHAIKAHTKKSLRILCACSPAYAHDDTEVMEAEPLVASVPPKKTPVKTVKPPLVEAVKLKVINGKNFKAMRESLGMNQSTFWKRVFVTQSGGSRYESGRNVPAAVTALLKLIYTTPEEAENVLAELRAPYQNHPPVRFALFKEANTGNGLKVLRKALTLNQQAFWKGLQTTQSGGSRYESGRTIPAQVLALTTLIYAPEHHAKKQLHVLRRPDPVKIKKPLPIG